MTRIGLVLGAGGVTGGAFHAGVLAGLAEGTGWDPRAAELVVGTSAGSLTGALLRAGLSAGDLVARNEGRPLSGQGAALLADAGLSPETTPVPPRVVRPQHVGPAAPGVLLAAARRPWTVRPAGVLAGLLPEGATSTAVIADGMNALFGDRWPAQPFWACAVRLDDGRLVVFGRDGSPPARVSEAVPASCAIPGYFRPVDIDGARFVDGGAFSLTNLSEVAGEGFDLVLVSAPMSRAGHPMRFGRSLVREAARAHLEVEAQRVRRRGTEVVAFQPTVEDQAVMGLDAMDPGRRADVARQARTSTLRRLERHGLRERLLPLSEG